MSSFFKFLAQTSPDLKKYLMKELSLLGLKPISNPSLFFFFYLLNFLQDINEIEFRANEETLFEVMYKVRTIEGLKLQIGSEISARGEKELEKNLKKLPWF